MISSNSNDSIKFELFLKVREIKQISKMLRDLNLTSKKQKEIWLKENQDFINTFLDTFASDSLMTLDGIALDDEEALNLSMDLMTNLRDAAGIISNLFLEGKRLRS